MFVRDWMTADVVTADISETTRTVWQRMLKHDIRRMPVVQDEEIAGIVSRTDLHQARPDRSPGEGDEEMSVQDVMTEEVITCFPDQALEEAATLLLKHELACLPVVDPNHRVAGIISEADFFRAFTAFMAVDKTDRRSCFEMPSIHEALEKGLELTEGFDRVAFHVWPEEDERYRCLLRMKT